MSTTIMQIAAAEVRFGACPGGPLDAAALQALGDDFSCQVTSAQITSTSNTSTVQVPATFCAPASERAVPVASGFALNLDFLQDWKIDTAANPGAVSLSEYLFKNDATEVCFALFLKGNENPVAGGKVIAQAGAFGGAPGQPLTSSVTLNIQGYPVILDQAGNALRDPLNISNDSADFAAAAAFADLVTLQADNTYGDGNFSGRAMTAGEYIVLGDGSKAHYKAGAWAAGVFA